MQWKSAWRRRKSAAGSIGPGEFVAFNLNQVNDDCSALKDLHISGFRRIRGNYLTHSAISQIGRPGVNYEANIEDAGGDWCDGLVSPARGFLTSGKLTSSAESEPVPAPAEGDHCREIAGKVRELGSSRHHPPHRRQGQSDAR